MSETEQGEGAGKQSEEQKPNAADHLMPHRFQPGVSGNPSGRPKGTLNISGRLEKRLLKELKDGSMEINDVISALIREMKADPAKMTTFILKLMDRDEGPVANTVELSAVFSVEDMTREVDRLNDEAERSSGRG